MAWHLASAEDTGLPDGSFDVASAAQCWHWFDGAAAAMEARRLLVPAGLLAIANFDWLPLPGSVSGETEALIQAHHPAWDLGGVREPLSEAITHVEELGFTVIEAWVEDVDVPYLADSCVGASAPAPPSSTWSRRERRPSTGTWLHSLPNAFPEKRSRPHTGSRYWWPGLPARPPQRRFRRRAGVRAAASRARARVSIGHGPKRVAHVSPSRSSTVAWSTA